MYFKHSICVALSMFVTLVHIESARSITSVNQCLDATVFFLTLTCLVCCSVGQQEEKYGQNISW